MAAAASGPASALRRSPSVSAGRGRAQSLRYEYVHMYTPKPECRVSPPYIHARTFLHSSVLVPADFHCDKLDGRFRVRTVCECQAGGCERTCRLSSGFCR